MGAPGGGRNPITPRYLRHYNLTWCVDYSQTSLERIFKTIITWHLEPFPGDVQSLCTPIVQSTIAIYANIAEQLLPTPAKSHYTYNLRDISKLPPPRKSGAHAARTHSHQPRVFTAFLHTALRFYAQLDAQLDTRFKKSWAEVTETDERRLLFGDFMKEGSSEYECMPDIDALIAKTQTMLEDFNAVSKRPMELVLFPFAIEHVCRILRVIKQPYGNALLVGMGGSGRQSLTTLAAHMATFELFSIELSKNYDNTAWRDDLKRLLVQSGQECKPTVFLFSDTQASALPLLLSLSRRRPI
eukprot:1708043-Pleurochrysis_carterae.AAC.2